MQAEALKAEAEAFVAIFADEQPGDGRCDAGGVQAARSNWLIDDALPTEGTLAQVAVSEYTGHLPHDRQCQICGRGGMDPDRSTRAKWCGVAACRLVMDETRAPVLDPKAGRTKTGEQDHSML